MNINKYEVLYLSQDFMMLVRENTREGLSDNTK